MSEAVKITFEQVEWVDSRGVTDRWMHIEDLRENHALHMLSVGWVIRENDDEIQIAPHVGVEDEPELTQVCGVMTIPKESIKRRSKLTKAQINVGL